jgi:hypothetical protein
MFYLPIIQVLLMTVAGILERKDANNTGADDQLARILRAASAAIDAFLGGAKSEGVAKAFKDTLGE